VENIGEAFAEAIAAREGLKIALDHNIWEVVLEGDSKLIIDAINNLISD
jgi:ribonuclease HI